MSFRRRTRATSYPTKTAIMAAANTAMTLWWWSSQTRTTGRRSLPNWNSSALSSTQRKRISARLPSFSSPHRMQWRSRKSKVKTRIECKRPPLSKVGSEAKRSKKYP